MEHYYVHEKMLHFARRDLATRIAATLHWSPADMKWFGGRVEANADRLLVEQWTEEKVKIMRRAVREKFVQNTHLAHLLLSSAGLELVEASGQDRFWGSGVPLRSGANGEMDDHLRQRHADTVGWRKRGGRNVLGALLMELRSQLAEEGMDEGEEKSEVEEDTEVKTESLSDQLGFDVESFLANCLDEIRRFIEAETQLRIEQAASPPPPGFEHPVPSPPGFEKMTPQICAEHTVSPSPLKKHELGGALQCRGKVATGRDGLSVAFSSTNFARSKWNAKPGPNRSVRREVEKSRACGPVHVVRDPPDMKQVCWYLSSLFSGSLDGT